MNTSRVVFTVCFSFFLVVFLSQDLVAEGACTTKEDVISAILAWRADEIGTEDVIQVILAWQQGCPYVCASHSDCVDDTNPCTWDACKNPETEDAFCRSGNYPEGHNCRIGGQLGWCNGRGTCALAREVCDLPSTTEGFLRTYAEYRNFSVGSLGGLNLDPLQKPIIAAEMNHLIVPVHQHLTWPERDRFWFNIIDNNAAFAEQHGMTAQGVSLIYKERSTPTWLGFYNRETDIIDPDCGGWGDAPEKQAELELIAKEFIQTMIIRGGNNFTVWKVVNEAIDEHGQIRSSRCWYRVLGEDFIGRAFEYAHEANPKALLMLNENFGWDGPDRVKIDGFFQLVDTLQQQDAPVHILGIQLHWRADELRPTYLDDLRYYFDQAEQRGLEVMITEMDVYPGADARSDEEKFERQREIYNNTITLCLEYDFCTGFQTWGISDKHSWLKNVFDDPYAAPLLFDDNYERKLSYYVVAEALRGRAAALCLE